jgi:steroid 5-alpha reductase family enzyme
MRQSVLNLIFSLIGLSIGYGIALLTGLHIIQEAVIGAFIIQWMAFIPAYLGQTEKFYDLIGSSTYVFVVGYVYFPNWSEPSVNWGSLLLAAFIVLWAARLGTFLFVRIKKNKEDKRFASIKPSPTRFFMAWTLQGMWVSLCAMCALTAIASDQGVVLNLFFYAGALVFVTGFAMEVIADRQKSIFRENPNNKDQFIQHGLWRHSRHPNYFGEITLWTGISIMSFSSLSGGQYITLISPVFTYILLVYISGVRILEEAGSEKWGHLAAYQAYVRETPALFPALRKKNKT